MSNEIVDRRKFLGGSDAAAVLGLSKFRTRYDVYIDKISPVPDSANAAYRLFLERRKRWEPVVFQMLREELEAEIVATNQRHQDTLPFLAAEIDAEVREGNEILNVEVKTVHPRAYAEKCGWGEPGTDDIPIEYEAQVQHGLGVTGRKTTILAAMVGLDDMVFYRINRNEAVIIEMRARLAQFWNEHVLKGIAPEPQGLTDVARVFPVSDGNTVEASPEVAAAALRLRALKAQLDASQAEADALEFIVKRHMGAAEYLLVEGKRIFSWKEGNWSDLDESALKLEQKEIYRRYLKKGRRRTFRRLSWTSRGED